MKPRFYMVTLAVGALFALSVTASANDGNEGSQRGPILGGGHGGMGGHGGTGEGGMMGWGRGMSALWEYLSQILNERNEGGYDPKQSEALREQIREKRKELSDLLRSDKPDKELLDEKIEELNRLESELDQKTSALGPRR